MSGTRAPKTIVVYDITGQTDYTIPFEYLARKFVVVTLIGQDRKVLTLNTDYRFTTKTTIGLSDPSPVGYNKIEIRRFTSATDRLVDFHDGSILRAYDLNLSQIQTLHVAEEARDIAGDSIDVDDNGDLDARGRKIVNLADAEDDTDAVNYGMLKKFDNSTFNNAQKAEASANAAKSSENKAKNSELRSIEAEAKCLSSAGTAMTAAADANRSKVAAEDAEQVVVPLVPIVEKASQDAAKAAADAAQAVQDVKDLGAVPIGTIVTFIKTPPAGYLKCDGSTFSQTEYPELYAYLGTNVLPNLNDRYLKQPSDEVNINQGFNAQMPDHWHDVTEHTHTRGNMEITGEFRNVNNSGTWHEMTYTGGAFHAGTPEPNCAFVQSLTPTYTGLTMAYFNASRTWTGNTSASLIKTEGINQSSLSIAIGQALEVKHHTVIFAIKAAGKVSDEGLMEVTQIKADVEKLRNSVRIWFTLGDENPADFFGGQWELINADATIAFGDGSVQTGAAEGNNNPTVPLPAHSHTFTGNALPAHKHQSMFPDKAGNIPYLGGVGDWSWRDTTAVSAGTPSGTISTSGTANATIDVRGARIKINVWKRID